MTHFVLASEEDLAWATFCYTIHAGNGDQVYDGGGIATAVLAACRKWTLAHPALPKLSFAPPLTPTPLGDMNKQVGHREPPP